MNNIKKITKMQLFLPIFSMLLVMLINVVFDIVDGKSAVDFFTITIKNNAGSNLTKVNSCAHKVYISSKLNGSDTCSIRILLVECFHKRYKLCTA